MERIDCSSLSVKARFSKNYTGGHRQKFPMKYLPFIAWDGEGWTDDSGDHHYMLFGNSLGDKVQASKLQWQQCFDLLLGRAGEGIHVIFGGTYDVIMMIKGMPEAKTKRLHKGKVTKYDGYRMQWFPHKMFYLSDGKRSVVLYDVMTFFACTFVSACRQYLGDDETLQEMERMKLERSSFELGDPRIIPYWESELVYLVRLMERLRELLATVGITPRGWHGPGAVAGALLSAHKMHHYYDEQPVEIIDIGERAYYGGRFEQFKVGRVPGMHEYDIRSAYPSGIAELPSFRDCKWEHRDSDFHEIDPFGLYCVSWDLPKVGRARLTPGPLPWRREDGRIFYPHTGVSSWYWGIEVRNLMAFKGEYWTIHEAYIPRFAHDVKPFYWVGEMYDTRAEMKRNGNPAQLALKLGLNSLYGKLAQSKGARLNEDGTWKKPHWHHILWAGWITANTRHEMFKAIWQTGHMVACETDAIFSRREGTKLNVGEGLGEWEHTEFDDTLYIQSGVYFVKSDGEWQFKSRGITQERMPSVEDWQEMFELLPEETIEAKHHGPRFGTIPGTANYGRWYDHTSTITLPNLNSKRIHVPAYCPTCKEKGGSYNDAPHFLIVPEPALYNNVIPSTPYPLPWRTDIKFEWPDELIVSLEANPQLEWSNQWHK